jgi:hypothetical protein
MKSSCNSSCWYICQSKKPTIGNFYMYKVFHEITSDNEPGGIENATHNTSGGKAGYLSLPCPVYVPMYCGLHFLFRRAYYHS